MDSVPSNYDNTLSFTIFSDPVDPLTVEPIPAITPPSPLDIPNSGRTLDDGLRGLEVIIGHPLRPQQQEALTELYNGEDVVLVASTGFGKTLVITGFHELVDPSAQPITLILSPLKAIENDQSTTLNSLSPKYRGFVLNGDSNTASNRHDIACGKYTHIWLSPEIALAGLVEENRDGKGKDKRGWPSGNQSSGSERHTVGRMRTQRFDSGYIDHGTFTSVIRYPNFRRRLHLVAIDELHLCGSTSWGGSFRPAMPEL